MSTFPPNPRPGIASRVAIAPASATVAAGSTVQLVATLSDALGNAVEATQAFVWQSSNPALLSVNTSGLCTAESVSDGSFPTGGQATVSASYPWSGAASSGATISAQTVIFITVPPVSFGSFLRTRDSLPGIVQSGAWTRQVVPSAS